MAELIDQEGPVAVTEPVIMEVVAGARTDAREANLDRLLRRFVLLAFDPLADSDAAARIYRRARRVGVTPRCMVDCMIAAVASRREASLQNPNRTGSARNGDEPGGAHVGVGPERGVPTPPVSGSGG